MRKRFSVISTVLLIALLVSIVPGGAVIMAAPEGGNFAWVPAASAAGLDSLELNPILAMDYGTFYWLELGDADFAKLAASGVPYTPVPDAGKVQVAGYAFDPLLDGEPALPQGMLVDELGSGFRLVQLAGPIQDKWLLQLEAAGLPLLQYYPHYSYLTWATAAQAGAVEALDFVRWQGTFLPTYKIETGLLKRSGPIANVDVMFYNDGNVESTLDAIVALGGVVLDHFPSQPDNAFYDAIVQLDAAAVAEVAQLKTVLWLGYQSPEPILDDEMSSQIVAGNYTGGVPFTGYSAWLAALGYDGAGVRWAVIDTGVDYDHPDLGPHIAGGYDFPGACTYPGEPGTDCPNGGHGTHVAGIIGGDATAGYQDGSGFYYGLGIAPAYEIFAMNSLSAPSWPPAGGWQEHSRQAVLGGAIGGNNSWTTGEGTNHGYQASERTHDFMVRDGNFDTTAVAEPFIEVFSAGNSGSSGLTAPKEAKNLTVVASSVNYRAGNIDSISDFSSWGPAVDGRWVPTVAAPGEQIASSRNDDGGVCATSIGGTSDLYAYCSGTSMAAPHVAGSITLATEWWRTFNGGADPSPAMAKALLVNGAVDMATADIPNILEGWGRVHLPNVIENGTDMIYRDQLDLFANTGESWSLSLAVPDPSKPFKVTLAWSDAPGAIGANPALVNNLDLIVQHDGDNYYGNVFSGGWSTTGGSPDAINNLENVYIQSPAGGATITVQATNIAGDGVPYNGDPTDQDFALVCYNCVFQPDFTLSATPDSLDVCAPDDGVYDVTVGSILSYSDPVTFYTVGEPAGSTIGFSVNPVTPPGSTVLTVSDTDAAAAGSYDIDIVGVAPTSTHTTTVGFNLYTGVPAGQTLQWPPDGAADVPPEPTFAWTAGTQGASYNLQASTDATFASPEVDLSGIMTTNHTLGVPLDLATCYFWRVEGENACGEGDWVEPFHFATVELQVSFADDMESGDGNWSHQADDGVDDWTLTTDQAHSPTHAWFVPDVDSVTDSYLWNSTPVALGAGSTLTFWHRHQFEASYDGSVLEISTNGGGTWTDLGPNITANGYNGVLSTNFGNPLGGRDAWVSDLATWTQVVVDLGSYAGQSAQFRWRIGCDSSVSDVGWYIDDVEVTSPAPPGAAPVVTSITPDSGSTYEDTPVVIEGSGFVDSPDVKLGNTFLLSVTQVSSTTLNAVVPAGMPGGVYALTLYNGDDCQEAALPDAYTVIVTCEPPTVTVSSDSPVVLGYAAHFTAELTSGTPPLTYTWDFGGPGTGTGLDTATPVFTYTTLGMFTALVTVENECGMDYQATDVTVMDPCQSPTVTVSVDSPVVLGYSAHFTAELVSGTPIFTYTWDFGGPGSGSGLDTATPVFTYTAPGSYTAVVTAENGCGQDTQTTEVVVRSQYPVYLPIILRNDGS